MTSSRPSKRPSCADAVIGIPQHESNNEGAAVFYLGSEGGLRLATMWAVKSSAGSGHFGAVVAPAGDVNSVDASSVGAAVSATAVAGLHF